MDLRFAKWDPECTFARMARRINGRVMFDQVSQPEKDIKWEVNVVGRTATISQKEKTLGQVDLTTGEVNMWSKSLIDKHWIEILVRTINKDEGSQVRDAFKEAIINADKAKVEAATKIYNETLAAFEDIK